MHNDFEIEPGKNCREIEANNRNKVGDLQPENSLISPKLCVSETFALSKFREIAPLSRNHAFRVFSFYFFVFCFLNLITTKMLFSFSMNHVFSILLVAPCSILFYPDLKFISSCEMIRTVYFSHILKIIYVKIYLNLQLSNGYSIE